MSFKLKLDPRSRASGRLIGHVTRLIREAFEDGARRRGLSQAKLAKLLEIDRSIVHRQLKVGGNLTLRSLSDYALALNRKVEIRLEATPERPGANDRPVASPVVTTSNAASPAPQGGSVRRVNSATIAAR